MEAQKEANRLFKKADKELHEKTKTTIIAQAIRKLLLKLIK